MKFQAVNRSKLKWEVERILHSPGARLHQILEIAVVVDCGLEKEEAAETISSLAFTLKSFGDTFRNVRVNVIWWKGDQEYAQEIKPLAALQMQSFLDSYEIFAVDKSLDGLAEYMRKFQARSKIVFLLLPEKELNVQKKEEVRIHMTPMLHRKWVVLQEEKIKRLSIEGKVDSVS